ncbi:hypothetical protein L6452_17524 [Arctium lappa]|uniref:Uncharacterized protein n=1 Tax=Arctium lappa TaxID=4217 RepID=A0ACB9C3L8_ARCLA|nr:hypothetical protein L6452_17524 [Arctium lappa]
MKSLVWLFVTESYIICINIQLVSVKCLLKWPDFTFDLLDRSYLMLMICLVHGSNQMKKIFIQRSREGKEETRSRMLNPTSTLVYAN